MTTAEMTAEVRATLAYDQDPVRLIDPATGLQVALSDERIVSFLNDACDRLGELCRLRASVTVALTVGTDSYDYQTAFSRRVYRLLRLGTGGANAYDLSDAPIRRGIPNGLPMRFQTFGDHVVIGPPPDTAATYYGEAYVLPTLLSAAMPNAQCDLPRKIHRDACRWAAFDLAMPHATETQQRVRLADQKTKAEQDAIAIGRESVMATSRGAMPSAPRFV